MDLPLITHPEFDESKLKSKGVSLVAFCDNIRKLKDDTCTIRLRIIFNRFPKYYSTKISMTEEDFVKMCGDKPGKALKQKKIVIYELLKKAHDIVISMPKFSFNDFQNQFRAKSHVDRNNVYEWYQEKISELKENDQVGNIVTYEYSMGSLKEFTGKQKLYFDQITPRFLERYEKWMEAEGKSPTTVGIYLRPLRHIYNRALKDKSRFLSPDQYPFDDYKIPSPKNIKKALTKVELKKIFDYQPVDGSTEHFYRDIWIFSYLCNGINMKDLCMLKYSNVRDDKIVFNRAKTKSTNKDSKPIVIVLFDMTREIINRWGNKPMIDDNFIFPFLEKKLNAEQIQARVKQATKQCNKYIRRVAKNLEIKSDTTTYTSRHTFATILKNSGAPIAFIGESMGHSSPRTTENYFGSFEDDQRRAMMQKLTELD